MDQSHLGQDPQSRPRGYRQVARDCSDRYSFGARPEHDPEGKSRFLEEFF